MGGNSPHVHTLDEARGQIKRVETNLTEGKGGKPSGSEGNKVTGQCPEENLSENAKKY